MLKIEPFHENHIQPLVESFAKNALPKLVKIFEGYLEEQNSRERLVWVATWSNEIAGYITLKKTSTYLPFQDQKIPEIKDLNVLPPFRRHGIGTALLDSAEATAFDFTSTIGISVGLYKDYGSAQRLYIKRGYIPDGNGVTYDDKIVPPGDHVRLDDDLVLWFTKDKSEAI